MKDTLNPELEDTGSIIKQPYRPYMSTGIKKNPPRYGYVNIDEIKREITIGKTGNKIHTTQDNSKQQTEITSIYC